MLERSVTAGSGPDVAAPLRRVVRMAEIFRFHTCEIEWRQHKRRLEAATDEILAEAEPGFVYTQLSEAERLAWLERELARRRPLVSEHIALSPDAADVIASLRTVASARALHGADSMRTLILAGNEAASDVLHLLLMARECGVLEAGPVQIVPLFESIPSLRGAPAVCRTLFESSASASISTDWAASSR